MPLNVNKCTSVYKLLRSFTNRTTVYRCMDLLIFFIFPHFYHISRLIWGDKSDAKEMGKKGNWFSALKRAFTASPKDNVASVSTILSVLFLMENMSQVRRSFWTENTLKTYRKKHGSDEKFLNRKCTENIFAYVSTFKSVLFLSRALVNR